MWDMKDLLLSNDTVWSNDEQKVLLIDNELMNFTVHW